MVINMKYCNTKRKNNNRDVKEAKDCSARLDPKREPNPNTDNLVITFAIEVNRAGEMA